MIITPEQKKHYDGEGYMILDHFFSPEETDRLREHIDRLDEESEQKLQLFGQAGISIANQINFTSHLNQKDLYIQQFTAQDKMVQLTIALLGSNVKLFWDQSVYKRPEASRVFPWHQDNGYVPIEPQHYVTCWLALEDATIENGCIWIQPRTHLLGLAEHKPTSIGKQCYFGDDPGIPVPLQKGGMVVFHSMLYHCSTPNLSKSTRKGYVIQYSVDGAFNSVTGEVFDNGPTIALDGKSVYVPK
jgi:phytanoyl-CoA hydroxylase